MQEMWDTMVVYLVSFQFTSFLIITVWWDFTSVPTETFSGGNTGVKQNKRRNSQAAGFAFFEFSVTSCN